MKKNILILIAMSSLSLAVPTTVPDSITGLEWQNTTATNLTWTEAISSCEDVGWRLANKNELYTLVDDSKYNPSINDAFVATTESNPYWTSTTSSKDKNHAWSINFLDGSSSKLNKSSTASVRCVRD